MITENYTKNPQPNQDVIRLQLRKITNYLRENVWPKKEEKTK